MEKEYYTIQELSKIFKVTPQGIRFFLKKDKYASYLSKRKINGKNITVINLKGFELLKEHYLGVKKSENKQGKKDKKDKQVKQEEKEEKGKKDKKDKQEEKDKQVNQVTQKILMDTINTLTRELEEVHKELQREQSLHLMDKQALIDEKKHSKKLENEIKQIRLISEKQEDKERKEDKKDKKVKQEEKGKGRKEDKQGKQEKQIKKTTKVKKRPWWQFWK